MNIQLIGVPLWYGCDNPGTEQAYNCFVQAGIGRLAAACGHHVTKCFPIFVPDDQDKYADPTMEYCSGTISACRNLEQAVKAACDAHDFPLVIGGDHALGIGSIAGISHSVPPEELTVIWVDAHTDINTNDMSESHHIHGMPLAACLGLGSPKLIDGFGASDVKLLPHNLFYLGARSVDPAEQVLLNELGIRCFDMKEIRSKGIAACTHELLSLVKTSYIHVSFDVDFMDGDAYHATGLPVPDGPSIDDAHCCLEILLRSGKVGSMDFVEYSPKNDDDRSGLATCLRLLETCFLHLK